MYINGRDSPKAGRAKAKVTKDNKETKEARVNLTKLGLPQPKPPPRLRLRPILPLRPIALGSRARVNAATFALIKDKVIEGLNVDKLKCNETAMSSPTTASLTTTFGVSSASRFFIVSSRALSTLLAIGW